MRLGLQYVLPHRTPEEWADELVSMNFRATTFPVDYKASDALIDAYVKEAKARDILIAEVGVWSSPFSTIEEDAKRSREACVEQLKLADYVGARCCVNVSGAFGPIWSYCYPENLTPEAYEKNLEFIRNLLDTVKPTRTCFTLESMPWMYPTTPEETLQMIKDVGSPYFKAHLDICNMVNTPWLFVNPRELIDRTFDLLKDELVCCHLKDIIMEELFTVHITEVIPGKGKMDIPRYLQRIQELGDEDFPVMIEHLHDKASYEEAARYVLSLEGFRW